MRSHHMGCVGVWMSDGLLLVMWASVGFGLQPRGDGPDSMHRRCRPPWEWEFQVPVKWHFEHILLFTWRTWMMGQSAVSSETRQWEGHVRLDAWHPSITCPFSPSLRSMATLHLRSKAPWAAIRPSLKYSFIWRQALGNLSYLFNYQVPSWK